MRFCGVSVSASDPRDGDRHGRDGSTDRRRSAGARGVAIAALDCETPLVVAPQLLLDMAPWATGGALLMITTGRPLFTGFVVLTLGAGFALADRTMREALREPIVFCTVSELPQVFTHPHLYLPFAGPRLVVGGALAGIAAAVALLVFEPPRTSPEP